MMINLFVDSDAKVQPPATPYNAKQPGKGDKSVKQGIFPMKTEARSEKNDRFVVNIKKA